MEVEIQIKETMRNDRVRDEGTQRGRRDSVRYEMRERDRYRAG